MQLEQRLRRALAGTHEAPPRPIISLELPMKLDRFVAPVLMKSLRPAAVLAPVIRRGDGLTMLFTRRSDEMRSHRGQISFPGGRRDDEDRSFVDAALREAREELGLDSNGVEVLGELDHLMTVTSRSFIVPFVALLDEIPVLEPNPSEVDAVLHVPVRELLLDEVYREERWAFRVPPPWVPPDLVKTGEPTERSIFFFELVGDTVWGATAAMLRHLLGTALGLGTAIDHR